MSYKFTVLLFCANDVGFKRPNQILTCSGHGGIWWLWFLFSTSGLSSGLFFQGWPGSCSCLPRPLVRAQQGFGKPVSVSSTCDSQRTAKSLIMLIVKRILSVTCKGFHDCRLVVEVVGWMEILIWNAFFDRVNPCLIASYTFPVVTWAFEIF